MSNELSRTCLTVVKPASGRKKAEMVWEVGIGARDRLARRQILRLEGFPIRRENELRLRPRRRRAFLESYEGLRDRVQRANGDVDVVGLEDVAQVGLVRLALPELLIVVSLLPKASRNPNGNSSRLKGCSASLEIAASISTAFMDLDLPRWPLRVNTLVWGNRAIPPLGLTSEVAPRSGTVFGGG